MGFNVKEPESYNAPLPDIVGPTVILRPCTGTAWNAVVVCASKQPDVTLQSKLNGRFARWNSCSSERLDAHGGWHFIRFKLPQVALKESAQVLRYVVNPGKGATCTQLEGSIPIAAAGEEWCVSAYSCYDQRRGVGHRLWAYMAEKAKSGERTVHALLGGGDQLYNDNLWVLEPLQSWLKMGGNKLAFQPDDTVKQQVADFYTGSYLRYLNFHPAAAFLRTVPQVNTWDDHDTFDGFGSYPGRLQRCPMFRMIFEQSQRFYCIFQLGTTLERAAADGFAVTPPVQEGLASSIHFATQLGPSLAVVAPDSRSQRSKKRILSDGTTSWLMNAVKQFPKQVHHVIVLSAIPILYPGLGILESLLKAVNNLPSKLLFKTGLYDNIYNHFDEPELLDDVTDHWSSGAHEKEKAELLEGLVAAARSSQCRLTIVSGDVHLCAVGYLQSKGAGGQVQATDAGFIPQIVSSAIGNKPPGNFVVRYIESCTKVESIASGLQQGMARMFDASMTPTGSEIFNNRQNFCELKVGPGPAGLPLNTCRPLGFSLVVLGGDQVTGDEIGDVRSATVPPLLPPNASQQLIDAFANFEQVPKPAAKRRWSCCGLF